jgi:hypothetical protein
MEARRLDCWSSLMSAEPTASEHRRELATEERNERGGDQ